MEQEDKDEVPVHRGVVLFQDVGGQLNVNTKSLRSQAAKIPLLPDFLKCFFESKI